MKNTIPTVKSYLLISVFLVLIGCNNADDEFYNSIFIEVPNLIEVETQSSYAVDDVLWINTNSFLRTLNEPGQLELLDIFATTEADFFKFSYYLEKQNGSNWELVDPTGNLVNNLGTAVILNGITGFSTLNRPINSIYEFRNGIKLTQTGNYRLTFFSSFRGQGVDIISENDPNKTYMIITTTVVGINGNTYSFSVN
jgi:hypothetical protein